MQGRDWSATSAASFAHESNAIRGQLHGVRRRVVTFRLRHNTTYTAHPDKLRQALADDVVGVNCVSKS